MLNNNAFEVLFLACSHVVIDADGSHDCFSFRAYERTMSERCPRIIFNWNYTDLYMFCKARLNSAGIMGEGVGWLFTGYFVLGDLKGLCSLSSSM